MTVKGREGMGMRKHGTSGRAPKSPKLRMAERLERDERKPRKFKMKSSIKELFK